jgi:type II secretory pathway component HofQ
MPNLSVALALAALTAAAPAPPAAPSVRERLAAPVTLGLREQSLRAAVDALREAAKVDIILDSVTIQQQLGFSPEQPPRPVNLHARDVPARVVLRRLADQYGLDYAVVGGSVVLSTEEGAAIRQFRQRVGVDFDKVELAAALKKLSADTGANLVLDPRVEKEASAKVSLQMEDVPLETAVHLLAAMAGLKPARVGNVVFVTTKAAAAEMRQDAPAPSAVGRIFLDPNRDW